MFFVVHILLLHNIVALVLEQWELAAHSSLVALGIGNQVGEVWI